MSFKKRIGVVFAWLKLVVTWQNIMRTGGLFGLLFLVVERERPEPFLIIACCAMMGLPTFWDMDKNNRSGGGGS